MHQTSSAISKSQEYIRVEKNFGAITFKSDVEKLPFATVYVMKTPEDKLDIFNCLFLSCLDKHAPLVKRKLQDHQRLGLKTTILREWNHLRQSVHVTKDQTAWNSYQNIRNLIKKIIRTAKSAFYKRDYLRNAQKKYGTPSIVYFTPIDKASKLILIFLTNTLIQQHKDS